MSAIAAATIQVTVVQKPFQFGYLVEQMDARARRPKANRPRARCRQSKIIDTGVEVINKTNVAEFKARLAEMKKN